MEHVLKVIKDLRRKILKTPASLGGFGKARQTAQVDILDVLEKKIIELYEKEKDNE